MPPTPARLHELLLACGFTSAQLDSITETALSTALAGITESTDASEQARDVVAFANRYNLMPDLTSVILNAARGRPAVQNLLLDDAMTLEDRTTQSIGLTLVKLEDKVERLSEKVGDLSNAVANLAHINQLRTDTARQPVAIGGKAIAAIVVGLGALVTAQVTLLAWLGALPHG